MKHSHAHGLYVTSTRTNSFKPGVPVTADGSQSITAAAMERVGAKDAPTLGGRRFHGSRERLRTKHRMTCGFILDLSATPPGSLSTSRHHSDQF
jgi:hypothetical protein